MTKKGKMTKKLVKEPQVKTFSLEIVWNEKNEAQIKYNAQGAPFESLIGILENIKMDLFHRYKALK